MRHKLTILLLCLVLIPLSASADFAESSSVFDPDLAEYAMRIAEMCYTPSMQASVLSIGGFRQVGVFNADRSDQAERHIATYAVYDRSLEDGSTEIIIAIRGTGSGEWQLNMDLMPSGNYDLPYAENFFLAAEDILTAQEDYFASVSSPQFMITGYSRGAAVANVLGAQLTDRFGEGRVYVYTFATPRTVRGETGAYSNIFNIVNPADLVTYLPFPQWGFLRYGTDIELPVEDTDLLPAAQEAYAARTDHTGDFPSFGGSVTATQQVVAAMAALAPDPMSAATVSHALAHPGEASGSEPGITASDFMLGIFDRDLFASWSANGQNMEMFAQAENDFTPLLQILQANGVAVTLTNMHMPATYGAWMKVIRTGNGASYSRITTVATGMTPDPLPAPSTADRP